MCAEEVEPGFLVGGVEVDAVQRKNKLGEELGERVMVSSALTILLQVCLFI